MPGKVDWPSAILPLLKKYQDKKHPLDYHSTYQLLILVVLSAQTSDEHLNALAPAFFAAFPDMPSLAKAEPQDLFPYISKIRNFGHKATWLTAIARAIKSEDPIPLTLEGLTALPGIGRKSANVILREAGRPAEGIIIDLHVIRVAPRLGIAKEEDPKKMEERLMKILPREEWDAGMAMSFLGREICRPTDPDCPNCLMKDVCKYYAKLVSTPAAKLPSAEVKSSRTAASKPARAAARRSTAR